jgi:hypothetical protein
MCFRRSGGTFPSPAVLSTAGSITPSLKTPVDTVVAPISDPIKFGHLWDSSMTLSVPPANRSSCSAGIRRRRFESVPRITPAVQSPREPGTTTRTNVLTKPAQVTSQGSRRAPNRPFKRLIAHQLPAFSYLFDCPFEHFLMFVKPLVSG